MNMKTITYKRLYNITLYYLGRYDASSGKVHDMLNRRIYKAQLENTPIPPESAAWINTVIDKMQELGYINDTRFAENQVRILSNQGKSATFIINKLKLAGIDSDTTRAFLQNNDTKSDLDRALLWLKKKKKGPFRHPENPELYQKDLAALARNGFSYETAVAALKNRED